MTKNKIIFLSLLAAATCGVLLFAAWSVMNTSAMTAILNSPEPQQEVRGQPFAQVDIPKPSAFSAGEKSAATPTVEIPVVATEIPAQAEVVSPQVEVTPTAPIAIVDVPTTAVPVIETPVVEITPVVDLPTVTPELSLSGIVSAQIVADTPTPEYTAPTAVAYAPITGSGERWIDVDLSQQRTYAYEGDTMVNSFLVSTGTWQTPTVTGKYHIWIKLRSTAMSGPGYYLPNVPYVMYFYGSYGLHGTYWHNNFGTPMSHGCVNLSIPDSEWLYNFASVGTLVNVHY